MLPLDLLEFDTRVALEVATELAARQRVVIEAAERRLADALNTFETELAEYNLLLDAIQEGQRRLAQIRDVRENL